ALGIDREKAGRRVIEVVNRVLQLLEHTLLALAVAGHVSNGPHGSPPGPTGPPRRPERAHPQPKPSRRLAVRSDDTYLLLVPCAVTARLEETIDRLRDIRIADEHALDRANILSSRRARKRPVGRIGVKDAPVGI